VSEKYELQALKIRYVAENLGVELSRGCKETNEAIRI
jgi:hypothetical protein